MRKLLSFVFCFCKFVGLILKMKKQLLSLVLICVSFASNSQLFTQGSGVADIDGNTYQTVIINGREYMAENLRVSKFNNGDLIPVGLVDTGQYVPYSYSYQGDSSFDITLGKYYTKPVILDSRGICPVNWSIPSEEELEHTFFFISQNNLPFNDVDSTLIRAKSVVDGGTNESGLNLKRGLYIQYVNVYSYAVKIHSLRETSDNPNFPPPPLYGIHIVQPGDYVNIRCIKDEDTTINITLVSGSGVSDIDGNNYGSVIFGNGQEWMTSNLKTSKFSNGNQIPYLTTTNFDVNSPAWCNYNFDPNYDNIYGKLYNFHTLRYEWDNICPVGWKVPAMYEWLNLVDYLGGKLLAGKKLKSNTGWGEVNVINPSSVMTVPDSSEITGWAPPTCDSIIDLNGTNISLMNIKPGSFLGDSDEWWDYWGGLSVFLSASYDPQNSDGESEGAFGLLVGKQFGSTCDFYYSLIDTSFMAVYLNGENLLATIDVAKKINYAYPEAGYIRCMRQSNGVGAVQTIEIQPTYTVYPNPAKDILNLELNGINPSYYVVFDAFGRELLKDKLQQKLTPISIGNLDSGCYFIQVEGQSQITRFIKN
jgi:uncharacterized protein (TIGR02145 family)